MVAYLLSQITYMMLAKSPVKDALQKASQKHEARLRAMLTPEEFEPIGIMRNIVDELARKLASCKDVATLEQCHAYIKAINDGEVLIAVEDEQTGEVVGYEPNR